MERFSMFAEWRPIGSSETIYEPLVLLDGTSEKDASAEAIAKADSLYPHRADYVLIRVVGDDNGRPIAEIRRPISN